MNDFNYVNFDDEKNKKFRSSFYVVISIVTLVVALVGASFSYFIASSSSADGAISVGSDSFSIDVSNEGEKLEYADLIPADPKVVYYSATHFGPTGVDEESGLTYYEQYINTDDRSTFDKGLLAQTTCRDDNGNGVCSMYTYTVTNTMNSSQTLHFSLFEKENEFSNLYLMVLDGREGQIDTDNYSQMTGVKYFELTDFEAESGKRFSNSLHLVSDQDDASNTGIYTDSDKSYDLNSLTITLEPEESITYKFILYIKNLEDIVDPETGEAIEGTGNQTEEDGNKQFSGYLLVSSGEGNSKIFGSINEVFENNYYND